MLDVRIYYLLKTMAELKFEGSFKKLEKIVEQLESGDLELDQALKLYEEGIKLSRFCTKKLQEAEKKVQQLTRGKDGMLTTEDMDLFKQEPAEEETE
jgi:exodeoxyribonuclease VII small subunit